MRHSFKYWLALTGIISLFLIQCPSFANAQKQLKATKILLATPKLELPKIPRYVPRVSLSPLPPTNSGTLLGTPARQVIIIDSKSVNLLSPPKGSVPNFIQNKPERVPNIQNFCPNSNYNKPTFAPYEKKNQQSFDATCATPLQEKDSEEKSNASRLLSPEIDRRWVEIGKEIEELGFRLGLEKKKKLLFNKGIKFEFKKKKDLVGFNNYNYGYEYELYAA